MSKKIILAAVIVLAAVLIVACGSEDPPPSAPDPIQPFRNCTEARDAGAAPVYRGDPRYGSHLDRDNDGIGCE